MLKGKKTYIVAAGGILAALGGYLTGQMSVFEAVLVGINSLGLSSLRAGIKSDVKGPSA